MNNIWSHIKYISCMDWHGYKTSIYKKKYIDGITVEKILDSNHVLNGEYGVFAEKKFKIGDVIGQYTGKIVYGNVSGRYVAELTNTTELNINAETEGNETRFINDYRNIKNKPNCCISRTIIDNKPCVLFIVIDVINIHDEILVDYGTNYWDYFSDKCVS